MSQLQPAETAAFESPVPTQVISNGEFNPLPQTPRQRQVEARIAELADANGRRLGMDRRGFLRTACGLATAFVAMNEVYGPLFSVDRAEAAQPDAAAARAGRSRKQFVFDDQLHFVRDDYQWDGLPISRNTPPRTGTRRCRRSRSALGSIATSSTTSSRRSTSTATRASGCSAARRSTIRTTGSSPTIRSGRQRKPSTRSPDAQRLLYHSLFTPKQPGWLDEVDRCIASVRPTSWKGYTIGDPLSPKTRSIRGGSMMRS